MESSYPKPTLKRVPQLDGVRGLSIAVVLLTHLWRIPQYAGGEVALELFFALSGFLISALLLTERERTGHIELGQFYLRRALRLLPALWLFLASWLTVITVAGLQNWTTTVPGFRVLTGQRLWPAIQGVAVALTYLTNWWMAYHWFHGYVALGHLWSLAVEEQFYLLWAPLLVLLSRRGARFTLRTSLLVAVISLFEAIVLFHGGRGVGRVYLGTDTRAAGILLGGVGAQLWLQGRLDSILNGKWGGAIFIAAAVALGSSGFGLDHGGTAFAWLAGWELSSIAAPIVITALVVRAQSKSAIALSGSVITYLGRRSYAIYLWHYAWATWLNSVGLLRAPLVISASILCAEASWQVIERRCWQAKLLTSTELPYSSSEHPVHVVDLGEATQR